MSLDVIVVHLLRVSASPKPTVMLVNLRCLRLSMNLCNMLGV
jgi:hypothetical protein